MLIQAWRIPTDNKDEFVYHLQVDGNINKRKKNEILRSTSDWSMTAEGYNRNNPKETFLMFTKCFKTKEGWLEWAKRFPFGLQELNRNGKPKPLKLGTNAKRKVVKNKNK